MHHAFALTSLVSALIILVPFIVVAGAAILLYRTRSNKDGKQSRSDGPQICQSLAEALKAQRTAHSMTQEQVAEAVGVSRQAVSKWENGTAEPSTSNLLALAKLYGVDLNELLRDIG